MSLRLGEHLERISSSGVVPARPVGADQHPREPGAIARPRLASAIGVIAHERAHARAPPRSSSARESPASRPIRSSGSAALDQPPRAPLRGARSASPSYARPGRQQALLVADRRACEQHPRCPPAPARSPQPDVNASQRVWSPCTGTMRWRRRARAGRQARSGCSPGYRSRFAVCSRMSCVVERIGDGARRPWPRRVRL